MMRAPSESCIWPTMMKRDDDDVIIRDEAGGTIFHASLDDATVARLLEVCDEAGLAPAEVIASIVHDVLLDDELAHREEIAAGGGGCNPFALN